MNRKIIVFSGPPCSGKSTLATSVASKLGIPHLQMDTIRKSLLPASKHEKADREIAYRAMHVLAEHLLTADVSVILDATYAPRNQRETVETMACRLNTPLHIIECTLPLESVRARFTNRDQDHPAKDLTEERVTTLHGSFPYFRQGIVVDTGKTVPECLETILKHLAEGKSVQPNGQWTASVPPPTLPVVTSDRHTGTRLTSESRQVALRRLRINKLAWRFSWCLLIAALLPAILKFFDHALVGLRPLEGLPVIGSLFGFALNTPWAEVLAWGAMWVAVAAIGGAFVPLVEYMRKTNEALKPTVTAGDIPRYEPVIESRPLDSSLYQEYFAKSLPNTREGFLIRDVPVYFVVHPTAPFNVRILAGAPLIDHTFLSSETARFGLNWEGFRLWQHERKKGEYDESFFVGELVRCTAISGSGTEVTLTTTNCPFSDYMCAELAVNLQAPGRLPDFRRLFEGQAWDEGRIDLRDLREAARRYSMAIGTAVLVTTSDGYVVLQRRSRYISEGSGGLATTATGFCDWTTDCHLPRKTFRRSSAPCPDAIRRCALRELREETGIRESHLHPSLKPFLGAAFNLLHGRDLNFYAHFQAKLNHREIQPLLAGATDRWEIGSLVFVHVDSIADDGSLKSHFANLNADCNRHLRGALFSFARSGRLAEVRAFLTQIQG